MSIDPSSYRLEMDNLTTKFNLKLTKTEKRITFYQELAKLSKLQTLGGLW